MGKLTRVAAAFCGAIMVASAAAETDVDQLVDAVADAYGGSALMAVQNYQIIEHYVAPATGQSWSPDLVDVGYTNQKFVHELDSGKIYFENWFVGGGGPSPGLVISDGEAAQAVNLQTNGYGDAASADPYAIAGGTMRTTDTLLVLELIKIREQAEYLGNASFLNREHALLKIPFPQSSDLTLYIDTNTYLVSRMTRENPQLGRLDYVFQDHAKINGIVRANNVNFSIAGEPNLLGVQRDIRFNVELDQDLFLLPEGLEQEGERITDTEMVVNRLANNVYHIGQNGGYSIFVDTGSEIVGCGGYAGLSARLARFRQETGSHRPLGYQVVSHHHQDHLGGIPEAVELGATLVTVTDNIEPIRQAGGEDATFMKVDARLTLGEGKGRVEIYDVSTLHSVSNLLVYVPSVRTVFMADHFNTPYARGVPVANRNTMSMSAALEPLDVGFKKVVTAHGARVYSAGDFSASVAAYRDYECPDDRPLCSR
jgi:glyoxylase-like metal-dependent hydrolase (beta-lactamase superfamily II)